MNQPPNDYDVRRAVRNYFGDEVLAHRAHAALRAWGDDALPHLRRMTREGDRTASDWNVVCAIAAIDTRAAMDLLVEVLDGETLISPELALSPIERKMGDPRTRYWLLANERFQPAMQPFAKSKSWIEQGQFAAVADEAGWKEAAPPVSGQLPDVKLPPLGSAETMLAEMAVAFSKLDPSARWFPEERLVPGLLGAPASIESTSPVRHRRTTFTEWFDGRPVLLACEDRSLVVVTTEGRSWERIETEHWVDKVLAVKGPDGARRWIAEVSPFENLEIPPRGVDLVALDETGRELWTYSQPRWGMKSITASYGPNGREGIVLGGWSGIVALDGQGKEQWKVANPASSHGLSSHPDLPDHILTCFGGLHMLEQRQGGIRVAQVPNPSGIYCHQARLFPGDQGPSMLVGGVGMAGEVPCLARIDGRRVAWRATLPSYIVDLAMLEPEGHGRLFVVATANGDFFLFDEEGVLRHRATVPGAKSDEPMNLLGVTAGELAPGAWGVVLRSTSGDHLYPLDSASDLQ